LAQMTLISAMGSRPVF